MQTDGVPVERRLNTIMAFEQNMKELRSPGMGQDTLEGRVPQIKSNERIASGKNIMDQYAYFLKNEEDLEESTATSASYSPQPPTPSAVLQQPHDGTCGW